jgi:signal transduction histidine kinase
VATSTRARLVSLGAEVALAFVAGAAFFTVAAFVVERADSDLAVALRGVAYVAAIVAMFRAWGVAYAVPSAMAGLLAFDWYYLPPTHPLEFPDSENLADLLVYLAVGVLIGQLAAGAVRRADVSEMARGELVAEQAALRRVATLVARGVSLDEVFAAVAEDVRVLLDADGARVVRYEGDGETSVSAVVPRLLRELGIRSGVGALIVVDGRLWGAILAWSLDRESLPDNAEARLAPFTELVATAISNTASREQLARLADEQTALRRVATLVARDVPPPEVFSAVARELGQLLGVDATHMGRYEGDGTVTGVASWSPTGSHIPVGTRAIVEGENVTALVLRTGRPARLDSYDEATGPIAAVGVRGLGLRSSVGAPIVVEGRLWGVMIVSSAGEQPLAPDTESRITAFTELVATAISNTEARAEVARLAEEQAALRRVATLVARESSPSQVFAAVAEEVGQLLGVENTKMYRYEGGGTATVVADWGEPGTTLPIGTSLTLGGENVGSQVSRTRRPARVDDYTKATGKLAATARELGVRSTVGTPIVVEGRLWGAMIAASTRAVPLPADAESRIEEFTELVATAISNMQARSDLAASRARVVAAADEERRRVVRDLHDGAQQRLVHTIITLKQARDALDEHEAEAAPALVAEALDHAEHATAELRELAHGILPSALTHGGLRAGVKALASRMPVPVDIGVTVGRLPAAVEATAYFVVAEALTNVAKHSHAEHAEVAVRIEDGTLRVDVRDDGVGGARPDGSGLLGLGDRLAALDGGLRVESPAGGGTLVAAAIPVS